MTQNIIINNDDTDFVQFTVELPDNYEAFKIDSINGTLINQNYLKIGDRLRFTFANNPITYDGKTKQGHYKYETHLHTINVEDMNNYGTGRNDNYTFLQLDTFKPYRVNFVPIYSYYDNTAGSFCYLFNPCDESQLLTEPTFDIPDYQVLQGRKPKDKIYAPFAGSFVLTLDTNIDHIEPIDIIFGESIDNSKTQPEDIGTVNEAGEPVSAENLAAASYNYGSAWTYNVSNLLMKHKMTILEGVEETEQSLAYFIKTKEYGEEEDPEEITITTPYDEFNETEIIEQEYEIKGDKFAFYTYAGNTYTPTNFGFLFSVPSSPCLPIVKKGTGNKKEHVDYDDAATFKSDKIPNGCMLNASDLLLSYQSYSIEYDEEQQKNVATFSSFQNINMDAYYSGNEKQLWVNGPDARLMSIDTHTITFKDSPDYVIITTDNETKYTVTIDNDPTEVDITFQEIGNSPPCSYVLGSSFETFAWTLTFIQSINTGTLPPTKTMKTLEQSLMLKQPFQLTTIKPQNEEEEDEEEEVYELFEADDDLLITHVVNHEGRHGLKISAPTLTNNIYKVIYTDDIPKVREEEMDPLPLVFIPKKTNFNFKQWQPQLFGQWTPTEGIYIIPTLEGDNCHNLTAPECGVFLAEGHETLNIEPPDDDDEKFKTFNGSITFDRSNSRITRIFANSQSNACLGYINDILSAKLARYYFVADYTTFDTFFDTQDKMILNNAKDQTFSIFNNYKDKLHTGEHAMILANCFDLVKLISSDTVVNNCMPTITPEEQQINAHPFTLSNYSLDEVKKEKETFTFKFFHYYNSGFNSSPYFGFGENDKLDNSGTIGGLSTHKTPSSLIVKETYLTLDDNRRYAQDTSEELDLFVVNTKAATDRTEDIEQELRQTMGGVFRLYPSNMLNTEGIRAGIASVLPCVRLYRNANFEQSDLTISTGRIKTLFPIFIQSVNRITVQNVLYMFDMMLSGQISRFGRLGSGEDDAFDYLGCYYAGDYKLPVNETGTLRRFMPSYYYSRITNKSASYLLSLSLDTLMIMNFLTAHSVNNYNGIQELNDSLPQTQYPAHNEEIIANIETNSQLTNVQLFSSRYFNFFDNVSALNVVSYRQETQDTNDLTADKLSPYFGTFNTEQTTEEMKKEAQTQMEYYIANFYNLVNLRNQYNITRVVKCFIAKLGEYLEFPKIIFGTTLSFNNSNTVYLYFSNPADYKSPFIPMKILKQEGENQPAEGDWEPEQFEPNERQKVNVSLFGVVFRYHQFNLGYQQLISDIQDTYLIGRSRGNRHFVLTLVDEFGRFFPNNDTSQGFKNNLKLEISCFTT